MPRIARLALATVAGVLAIGLACWWAVNLITANTKADTANTLTTVLNTSHQALLYWFEESSEVAKAWAASPEVRQQAAGLLAGSQEAENLRNSVRQRNLDAILSPAMMEDHSQGYFLVDAQNRVLAASNRDEIGEQSLLSQVPAKETMLLSGESFVSLPLFRSRGSEREATILGTGDGPRVHSHTERQTFRTGHCRSLPQAAGHTKRRCVIRSGVLLTEERRQAGLAPKDNQDAGNQGQDVGDGPDVTQTDELGQTNQDEPYTQEQEAETTGELHTNLLKLVE